MKRKLLPLASVLLGTILSAGAANGGYAMRYGLPPPPRPRAVWVPGSWSQSHRGWTFRRGYWR